MPTAPRKYRPPGTPTREQSRAAYDASRKEDHRFYCTQRWQRYRKWFLSLHPTCEWCEQANPPRVTRATQVDHRKPRVTHPELAYVEGNCRACCASCHAKYGAKRPKTF